MNHLLAVSVSCSVKFIFQTVFTGGPEVMCSRDKILFNTLFLKE